MKLTVTKEIIENRTCIYFFSMRGKGMIRATASFHDTQVSQTNDDEF